MPTIKRSDKGIEIKATPGPSRVSGPQVMDAPTPASAGPQFREECEVIKAPTPEPQDRLIHGLQWTPIDKDRQGNVHTYLCENRAMKITANLRREQGEVLTGQTQWLLFQMGALVFRSTDLNEVFEHASLS